MMTVHLPISTLKALHETAVRIGGPETDPLIAAAVWGFSRQEAELQNLVVRQVLFQGFQETGRTWQSLSVPPSAHRLLSKTGVRGFSKTQALVAILHWFATRSLALQLQVIRAYESRRP
jgi:hypothetical protein